MGERSTRLCFNGLVSIWNPQGSTGFSAAEGRTQGRGDLLWQSSLAALQRRGQGWSVDVLRRHLWAGHHWGLGTDEVRI